GGVVRERSDEDEASGIPENGNGHNHGVLRQFADRLSNAAKVRDVRSELATALAVSKSQLAAAAFHNIEHHRAHLASSFFVSPFERAGEMGAMMLDRKSTRLNSSHLVISYAVFCLKKKKKKKKKKTNQ